VIPDVITGIGYLDDLILVVLILQTFIEMSPDEVVFEHCQRLGIHPDHLNVDIAGAITTSIGAVLPLLEKRDSGEPASGQTQSRYSSEPQGDQDNAVPEVSSSPQAAVQADNPRLSRYSAYSTQKQD
jgi:hypothetical protein